MWNQPEHVEVYFALPSMGAVLHTLNPRLHPDELSFIVNDAEDRAIVVDESLLEQFEAFHGARDFEHVIVVSRDEPVPDGYLDYDALIAGAEPMEWPARAGARRRRHVLHVGDDGEAQGRRVLTPRRWCCTPSSRRCPTPTTCGSRDTVLPVVPMFHANAWGLIFTAALVGAGLALPGPRLDAVSVLDLLESEEVTVTAGVPTVWMTMLQAIDAEPDRWDLRKLRMLLVGGSAVPRSMLEGFDRHGLTIVQAWGMTETSPLGSVCRLPARARRRPRRRALRVPRPPGPARARSSRSARAATTASSSPGTTRRWASSRSGARGWRGPITRAEARRSSPTTAGSPPATWSRSTPRGT